MLATNHGMVGMVVGALLPIPIAIPVAFASHFIMDATPHYGISRRRRNSSGNYRRIVRIDTTIALSFALITAVSGRWDMFWIGWVAYGPDAYWVYLYFKQKKSLNLIVKNRFAKFHQNIQREYPWGLWIEMPVAFVLFISFLVLFL